MSDDENCLSLQLKQNENEIKKELKNYTSCKK